MLLLFTLRARGRVCETGRGQDVINPPKEQHWTSDGKCDEAQRPPGAYQADDFSLSDVILALSTEMKLIERRLG